MLGGLLRWVAGWVAEGWFAGWFAVVVCGAGLPAGFCGGLRGVQTGAVFIKMLPKTVFHSILGAFYKKTFPRIMDFCW